mmetsp:Transcript_78513/g.182161  ORF Transcript_78513/g.182161 Transcript_78513/m.182161 type:complete len:210 (-) Transcript_78513:56-685(-)
MLRLALKNKSIHSLLVLQCLLILRIVTLKFLPPLLKELGHLAVRLRCITGIHGRVRVWHKEPSTFVAFTTIHPLGHERLTARSALCQLTFNFFVGLHRHKHVSSDVVITLGSLSRFDLIAPCTPSDNGVLHGAAGFCRFSHAVFLRIYNHHRVSTGLLTATPPAAGLLRRCCRRSSQRNVLQSFFAASSFSLLGLDLLCPPWPLLRSLG